MPLGALLARMWRDYVQPRWLPMLLSMILAGGSAWITYQVASLLKPAIDQMMEGRDSETLLTIPATFIGLAVARALIQIGQTNIVNRVGHGLVSQIQVQLFERLVHADLARLRTTHSGAYVSSVLFDAGLIRQAATDGVVKYTQQLLTAVFLLGSLLWMDWLLGLMVLSVAPIATLVIRRFSKRAKKAVRGAMAETSSLSTALMESLDGVKIVKMEGREDFEIGRVRDVVGRRQKFLVKGSTTKGSAGPIMEMMMTILLAAVMGYVGWRSQAGQMTVGDFMEFVAKLLLLGKAMQDLAQLQATMSEGIAASRRLLAGIDIQPEIRETASPKPLPAGPAEIVFDKVSFSYNPEAPALTNTSIRAAPGETVALVGPSGGGKSTILNLIPRFYDPDSGVVRVNGLDVRDVSMKALRDRIALVMQEPFLFDDTIRANIAYSRPQASDEEIVAAAEAAAAHEFIQGLPRGYDTTVGEAGARLSGGQRQRIAIARAFLKDAPILLLDEATSALDTESEAKVQEALDRLMVGRTTVMIAHRLSTVRHADRIYVIEAGRVVEQGTHAALVRKGGLYARLAKGQDLDTPVAGAAE
ncbi:MAG: ATP-binding cassette domain-containing protein [Caulobacteraceae bacterium]|nr:ATP-binding cassette domain-containing protein [Caulobacteraceae bacterium]